MVAKSTAGPDAARQPSRNRSAAGFMLVVVLGFSIVPLVIDLGGGAQSPFLFNAVWRLGVVAGFLLFLLTLHRDLLRNPEVRRLVWRNLGSWKVRLAILGNCEYVLFFWSARFIDISVTTILYEVWPVLLVLLVARLYRGDGRYRKLTLGVFPLFAMAFVGFLFAAASGTVQPAGDVVPVPSYWRTAGGVLLAAGAALLAPLMAFGFKWASELSGAPGMRAIGRERDRSVELFFVVVAGAAGSSGAALLSGAIGWSVGETLDLRMAAFGFGGGMLLNATAGIAWRKANFITDNLGINALAYLTPIFALVWLAVFAAVGVANFGYLAIGAAAIIAANLLINLGGERQCGVLAGLIFRWVAGAAVYLRAGWNWLALSGGYFELPFLLVVGGALFFAGSRRGIL